MTASRPSKSIGADALPESGHPARRPRRGAFRKEVGPNPTPRWMLVVVGYRMGTITSFPLGEPVLSSSTTAEIASDSGTMRPIAGTELASLGRFGNARQGLWRRIAEHQVMSRREQASTRSITVGGERAMTHEALLSAQRSYFEP